MSQKVANNTHSPNQMTAEQLEQLGVRRLNKFDLQLQCLKCRNTWSPRLTAESELPEGYWRCPNRCNW